MKKIKNSNKGFSLVELIVVIAIMAVMTAVLAPALLQYVEKSRAQKDDSAMGEVVEVVKLALADQDVYDECLCYTVEGNKANYKIGNDEEPWELEGAMRGLTITFHADKNANATKFNLSAGKINEFVDDSAKGFNGGNPKSTLGAMTANNVTNELYAMVRAGIEDGEVDLTSQTYRNSDYTIFITMGASDEAVNVYGQWGGTNLASGVAGGTGGGNQEETCTQNNDCKVTVYEKHIDGCPKKQGGGTATLEGDGQKFFTLAPTQLSFRSPAPLDELEEVQVDGETITSPQDYIATEGSTIVTLTIDYLKTLEAGTHEITIVSENYSASAEFEVVEPEKNGHGFYYNQPYTGYVEAYGSLLTFFLRNDNTMDTYMAGYSGEECSFTIENGIISATSNVGTFTFTPSLDGVELYCSELDAVCKLGDESVVADKDYIYIYDSSLNGYVVHVIDKLKTRAEYGSIRTGINGKPTVKLAEYMFVNISDGYLVENNNLVCAPLIPDSVTSIGEYAFGGCTSLTSIIFEGTTAQWNAITKGTYWNYHVPATYVQCSDGTVSIR